MITSLDFDRCIYKKPRLSDNLPKMSNIYGLDSESYTSGEPFIFCVVNTRRKSDIFLPRDIPFGFFPKYENANIMIYNMKYDSGGMLYNLPYKKMHDLWYYGSVFYNGFMYKYIPHKFLQISRPGGNHGFKNVYFWDIAQFFKTSLNDAAKTYLHKRKKDIRTKNFSYKYVNRFFFSIADYCIQDAFLTAKLGKYLVDKLDQFGITASKIYSCASISFKYFSDNTKIVTSWRYWKIYQNLLKYACDAYQGGKFEIQKRGNFYGYEYDITSAYPYHISNLIDISDAEVLYSSKYQKNAVYGFIRVYVDNSNFKNMPCGIKYGMLRVYPAGKYFLTITKQEYDYLLKINVPVEIISGYWLFVKTKKYPYRKVIKNLFEIKNDYKGKDLMLYNTSKIVMNSFYGKCAQCIEQPDKKIHLGSGWNPIYASVITAKTRIQVCEMQNFLQGNCFAVHTDSIITDKPLPQNIVPGGIGNFEYVTEGESILIASGMYQIGSICAFRGFNPVHGETWKHILQKNKNRDIFRYKYRHVESWIEAMSKNHKQDCINVFSNVYKEIDLNCDSKRNWMEKATGKKLLETIQDSFPYFHIEKNKPDFWY